MEDWKCNGLYTSLLFLPGGRLHVQISYKWVKLRPTFEAFSSSCVHMLLRVKTNMMHDGPRANCDSNVILPGKVWG